MRYQPWLEETQAIYCSADHPLFAVEEPDREQIENARWVKRGYLLAQQLCPIAPPHRCGSPSYGKRRPSGAERLLSRLPAHPLRGALGGTGLLRQLGGAALSYRATLSPVSRPVQPDEALNALLEDLTPITSSLRGQRPIHGKQRAG